MNKKINSISFLKSREINILDVGCGAGIFSFIFILKNIYKNLFDILKNVDNHETECEIISLNLYLTDIDPNCIRSSYINFNNYKELFKNHIRQIEQRKYKIDLKLINLSVGDLIKNLTNNKDEYYNLFDYILANLPQTPSQEGIRSKLKYLNPRRQAWGKTWI